MSMHTKPLGQSVHFNAASTPFPGILAHLTTAYVLKDKDIVTSTMNVRNLW